MKPEFQAQQGKRPWLALLAVACLLLAIPAGYFASAWFVPAEDLLGYHGLAAGIAGIGVALVTGVVLAVLSLLRREAPCLLSWLVLLATGIALVWLLLNKPG
jgi:hypothetical protein